MAWKKAVKADGSESVVTLAAGFPCALIASPWEGIVCHQQICSTTDASLFPLNTGYLFP